MAALLPGLPHPILLLGGEQGTGKSTAARMLVGLLDPSPAPLRCEPRDAESWAVAAGGSWLVCVDNVSRIPPWWSDALCRAVTGEAWIRRRLYTNDSICVTSFRRVVALTSIDAGALRGDLGDRMLLVDMEAIPEDARRTDEALDASYRAARPRLSGALLDLLSGVLQELPHVRVSRLPRMADFARVLAALDATAPELTGGQALRLYLGQGARVAQDVLESDPVGMAVLAMIRESGRWVGSATELQERLRPDHPPRGWPKGGRPMGARLRRWAPALRQAGVTVDYGRSGSTRRAWTLGLAVEEAQENVHNVRKRAEAAGGSPEAPRTDEADDMDAKSGHFSAAPPGPEEPSSGGGVTGGKEKEQEGVVRRQVNPYNTGVASIIDAIRQAVEDSDKTRAEISRETGVSEAVLSRLVRGERGVTAETAERIANALGLEFVLRRKHRKQKGR